MKQFATINMTVRVRRMRFGVEMGYVLKSLFPETDYGLRFAIWWAEHIGYYEWRIERGKWKRDRLKVELV